MREFNKRNIDKFYEEMEEEYIAVLREELLEKGYRNAGITMTKIFYENGSREYTVRLHHKKMCKLGEREREILLDELSQVKFADSECKLYLKFL